MIGSGRLTHCVCVFVISAERLQMIGVTDTACSLLGSSSQRGQTGGTRVYENDPWLSSVYHNNTHTYTACVKRHKHTATWQSTPAVDV